MPYKDKEQAKKRKREYYLENKDRAKKYWADPVNYERKRLRDISRRVLRKKIGIEKLGGVCVDCKQSYPLPCYDFHHIDPNEKEFDPCSGLTKKLDVFLAEIEKCVLLCANCHRIRHFTHDSTVS